MKNIGSEIKGLQTWMVIWLSVAIPIVLWDVLFVLSRPHSMSGGSLEMLWAIPYAQYIQVDKSYGDLNNAFIWAQAIMSIFEAIIGLAALLLNSKGRVAAAMILAFCSTSLTSAKTILIFLVEICSGFDNIGHNSLADMATMYFLPNGLWIIIPMVISVTLGREIVKLINDNLEEEPTTVANSERVNATLSPA